MKTPTDSSDNISPNRPISEISVIGRYAGFKMSWTTGQEKHLATKRQVFYSWICSNHWYTSVALEIRIQGPSIINPNVTPFSDDIKLRLNVKDIWWGISTDESEKALECIGNNEYLLLKNLPTGFNQEKHEAARVWMYRWQRRNFWKWCEVFYEKLEAVYIFRHIGHSLLSISIFFIRYVPSRLYQ